MSVYEVFTAFVYNVIGDFCVYISAMTASTSCSMRVY